MLRLAAPAAVLAMLAALVVAPPSQAASHRPKTKTLYGEAGPGLRIHLDFRNFHRVRRLKSGRYTILVQDRSTTVNFHLVGPGVNRKTPIDYLGFQRWSKLRLKRGTYRYFSDSNPKKMKGSFVVR